MKSKPSRSPRRAADADKWFHCVHCGQPVMPQGSGTEHRNHCPWCLWSRHLDDSPGDRAADCGGAMEPISVWVRPGADWAILHRCRRCGTIHSNRIAGDDNELALLSIAVRPVAQPSFPLAFVTRAESNEGEESPRFERTPYASGTTEAPSAEQQPRRLMR